MITTFNQHAVFICSTGRTGTQFLAQVMSDMITDCTSVHEPGTPWISKPGDWPRQIRQYGLYHMTIGQLKASHSMYKLSTERCRGRVTDKEAKEYIHNMRQGLIEDIETGIYVEASGHMYGALDLLAEVFPNSKFVFIIRDPRNWVRSALNTFEYILYGSLDINYLELSLRASYLEDDPYCDEWSSMSKFAKYCWYYNKLNSYVFKRMQDKDNFAVYRHEDLFSPETRDQTFTDMLSFASTFADGFSRQVNYKSELMEQKVHSNAQKKKFPRWPEWSAELTEILWTHCGDWMEEFGYGQEAQWQEKIEEITST